MSITTPNDWANMYLYVSRGMVPLSRDEISTKYDLELYLSCYLAPISIMATSLSLDELDWSKLAVANDEMYSYISSLPKAVSLAELGNCFENVFQSPCWVHSIRDMYDYFDFTNTNKLQAAENVAKEYISNYTKSLVTFGCDSQDVYIYLHKVTREPLSQSIGTNFVEYVKGCYPAKGRYTLKRLISMDPTELTYDIRCMIARAVHDEVISEDDLEVYTISIPVGNRIEEVDVNALSLNLPPKPVLEITRSFTQGYLDEFNGDPYRALKAFVESRHSNEIDTEVLLYLESIKDYFNDELNTSLESYTNSAILDEAERRLGTSVEDLNVTTPFETRTLDDYTTDELICAVSERLNVTEQKIRDAGKEHNVTDEELLKLISDRTNIKPSKLEHLCVKRELTNDELIGAINSRLNTSFLNLTELTADKAVTDSDLLREVRLRTGLDIHSLNDIAIDREITDAEILMEFNRRSGNTLKELKPIEAVRNYNDNKRKAAEFLIKFISEYYSKNNTVEAQVAMHPIASIATLFLVTRKVDIGAKVAYNIYLNRVSQEFKDTVNKAYDLFIT